jgi:nitroreductase/NAD-dependent dihydropyrimidine dehydrogenase PreA subunit
MSTIVIDETNCTHCSTCATICPSGIIEEIDGIPSIRPENEGSCIACGQCEATCPTGALKVQDPDGQPSALSAGRPMMTPDALGLYLQSRRSVRHFKPEPVSRETIEAVMEIVRYAPSGANMQPVQYIIITDPAEVKRLAGVTIDWMRDEIAADSPLSRGLPLQHLVDAWEQGSDPICRGAPHLVIAHTPAGNSSAPVDAIIGLTHFDVTAPAFGVGACWAGFLSIGAMASEKVKQALAIPEGRVYQFALFFGYPKYTSHSIPSRKPARIEWR